MGNIIVCKDIRILIWMINVIMIKLLKLSWREILYDFVKVFYDFKCRFLNFFFFLG